MKEVNTKKLVLGCFIIMLFMIAYTKVKTGDLDLGKFGLGDQKTSSEQKIGGADGPASLLLTERLNNANVPASENENTNDHGEETSGSSDHVDEEDILGPAESMDLETALKEPYGLVAELDYVSANRISLHGSFGYMVFSFEREDTDSSGGESGNHRESSVKPTLERAVTFEELGGINMGGAAYTDILAGEGIALIVPGIHNKEIARRRKFLYIEETNEITGGIVAPPWMMEKMSAQDYSDAVEESALKDALKHALGTSEYKNCKLLYGPVVIPEFDSNTYGFLSADGENLESLWYGMWNADLNTLVNVPLFR